MPRSPSRKLRGGACSPANGRAWGASSRSMARCALSRSGSRGYDPQLGARPLKRLIQQVVVNPLSRLVLEGHLKPGGLARLVLVGDELRVEPAAIQ